MRTANGATIALLASSQYVSCDLWTITLNGGAIIRWHSADIPVAPIKYGGNSWTRALIHRGPISEKLGPDVATLEMSITALDTDLINGKPTIPFIANHGFDGASVKLERAFAPDWKTMVSATGPTGTVVRFAGKITNVNSIQGAVANITISSWMVLLNADMPRNLYQSACMHSLYDSGCTMLASNFATNGAVVGAFAVGAASVATNLTAADGYFNLGRIVFTSGSNNGISRTVKSYSNSSGLITFSRSFPNAFAGGETFTAYAGCDLTKATCAAKFNNLVNYKGTDFVPYPTTPLTIPATSTTSSSGKGGAE